MSLCIDAVDHVDAIAVVRVLPCVDATELGGVIACWRALQDDPAVGAVAVLTSSEDFSSALPTDDPDVVTIGPKSVGLVKPFGLGLRGDVFDYGLQLLGEADTVIVGGDTRIADTSIDNGRPAVHASRLSGSLPDAEINRLALLGLPGAMTAARAVELGLVDEIVVPSDLETRLMQRLLPLVGREHER